MATCDDVIKLYLREREYQKKVFGDYKDLPLNLASFMLLNRVYLNKAEDGYVDNWKSDKPPWLITCDEFESYGAAPIKSYIALIKNFALHGAAIETLTVINPTLWRIGDDINTKWL